LSEIFLQRLQNLIFFKGSLRPSPRQKNQTKIRAQGFHAVTPTTGNVLCDSAKSLLTAFGKAYLCFSVYETPHALYTGKQLHRRAFYQCPIVDAHAHSNQKPANAASIA